MATYVTLKEELLKNNLRRGGGKRTNKEKSHIRSTSTDGFGEDQKKSQKKGQKKVNYIKYSGVSV